MAKPAAVILALQTLLRESATLSYIDDTNIVLGMREKIVHWPFICIEPIRMEDADKDESRSVYDTDNIDFHVEIIAFARQLGDKDDLIADSTETGILKLENDIKTAIDADRTIATTAIHTWFFETLYGVWDYPVRAASIEILIRIRETLT